MSVLMLLANCTVGEPAKAAESDNPPATQTDAGETVTIYKGGSYAYGEATSNWYSTDGTPDGINVNAYSIVSGYEMSENSITAEPSEVTDEALIKAEFCLSSGRWYRS